MLSSSNLAPRSIDVQITDIPRHINFLEEYLGAAEITRRLKQIDNAIRAERGVYLRYWLLPNSSFWLGVQEARKQNRFKSQNEIPRLLERPIEISAKLQILQKSMSPRIWNDFRTRILGSDYLSPIFFEIDTASSRPTVI